MALGPLRAGLSFCPIRMCLQKTPWTSLKWSWRRVTIKYQTSPFRSHKIQIFHKVTLICWGIREVTTSALCDSLYRKDLPVQKMIHYDSGTRHHPGGILKKVHFIVSLGVRAFTLFLKFGPLLLTYPFTFLSATFNSLWLRLLLKATETSGPACIKLGQWASTRRDLFSEHFCSMFSKLHVQVPPHSWGYTERCLERAFGGDWRQVLRFESRDPVGSGCVAQVYKGYANLSGIGDMESRILMDISDQHAGYEAWEVPGLAGIFGRLWKWRLFDNKAQKGKDIDRGTSDAQSGIHDPPLLSKGSNTQLIPVAIKVLHPGLSQQVTMDLLLMKTWSRLIGFIPGFRWLSLTEIVEEFEKLMTQQIDLRFEARNLELFQQKFERVDIIKFPTPLRPFVTRNILVETFEEGEPLSRYLQEAGTSEIKRRIATMGVDMLLKMVFVDNFVHADLHPGNILVQGTDQFISGQVDQTTLVDMCDTLIVNICPSRCPLRLVLLDAGIVAELQETDLQNFRAVFTAVVLGQGERVAELILHHARANQCKDEEGFKTQMAQLVNEARKNTISLGKVQVAVLLSQVFRLLMTHKVKLESNFASIVFAIMVLEGLGRFLDPDIDILEAAKPFLLNSAASLLT